MKRLLPLLLIFAFATGSVAQETPEKENKPIRIDRNHSTVGFNVPIVMGLSKVAGKFTDFSVDLIWDASNLEASSVRVTIQAASIDTGIDGRNEHLRSDDFFDVEVHPEISFVSSSILRRGDEYFAQGVFTMHGVSKDIFLPFSIRSFQDAANDSDWTAFTVNYTIDRTDYNMNWTHSSVDYFVGNDIQADIVIITR